MNRQWVVGAVFALGLGIGALVLPPATAQQAQPALSSQRYSYLRGAGGQHLVLDGVNGQLYEWAGEGEGATQSSVWLKHEPVKNALIWQSRTRGWRR